MTQDIVERLRTFEWRGKVRTATAHEATELVEKLRADNERLREGPAYERAEAVAYLRKHAARRSDNLKADAIERGEHLGVYPLGASSVMCYGAPHNNSTPHSEANGARVEIWENGQSLKQSAQAAQQSICCGVFIRLLLPPKISLPMLDRSHSC